MFPAHDVSGVHPLSCLSLSQREAITSPGQVQRFLDKGDGRGNLPGLHPIRTVTVIRAARLWTRSACQTPAFFPPPAASRGVPVSSLLASLPPQKAHLESPVVPQ